MGTQLTTPSDVVNFNYSYAYTLSCVAQSSRPSVSLQLYDLDNQKSLEEFNTTTVNNVVRTTNCDQNSICNSTLTLNIVFNDPNLLFNKMFQCIANNATTPYEINVVANLSITVTDYTTSRFFDLKESF